MSRIEAGRQRIHWDTVDLNRILHDSLRVLSGRAQDKRVALTTRIADNVSFVARSPRRQAGVAQSVAATL